MNIYPGDPEVVVERTRSIETDGWEVRALVLGTHTGTHVDAFSHVTAGRLSIDDIPLDRFYGPARRVSSSDNLPYGIGLLMDFSPGETDIDTIIQACPLFVGCNQLRIEVERPLLDVGIVTYDGLVNIDRLPADRPFQFYGFPLKIAGGDGSPVRAVALID
jgi:kynurenine formamidase